MSEDKNNKKVYIVDDNKTDCETASKYLRELGYSVDVISDEHSHLESIIQNFQQSRLDSQNQIDCSMVSEHFNSLTNREKQVVELLALGSGYSTNKSIAKKLDISHRTVEEYRAEAMRKMHAKSYKDLITMVIVCKLYST